TTGAGAKDGNAAANRTALTSQIAGLNIPSSATFWIRWADVNVTSSDDGLAVDDFSLTPRYVDGAPSVVSSTPTAGAVDVPRASNVSVTFSEPVDVTGSAFQISCATSGLHATGASGGPTTYTLDPTVDFASNEVCTVTVFATEVADQDADDPPNNMAGDSGFSFSVVDEILCGAPATFIHDVQGIGTTSPLAGQTRQVEGIVVGDYQGTGQFGGFYVQEEDADADADPQTSEGIFVTSASPVSVGDHVRVRGTVGETGTLTRLNNGVAVVCSTGNTVTPTVVNLPIAAVVDWERYEGMRISIDQELTVTEVFTLARFGEAALSVGGRLATPTNVAAPGGPAQALQEENNRRRILLDDGNNQQNIDPTFYPQGGGLSASNTLRVGDTTASLTGVLDHRFSAYRVQPIDPTAVVFTHSNPRPATPEDVGGDVKVAAFNVLNYFNGDGAGGGFPTARGAETLFELGRQRAKEIAAITAMDADVVGLMELENDDTDAELGAIEDLVAGLNDATAPGTYDFINTGVVGTDAIRVGILYQPARVTPVGDFAIMDSTVDPRFIDTRNRPSIAQTFQRQGDRFTVVVNHLKSKGSACDGDPDTGDGQGNCNGTRTAAVEALTDWIATDPTDSGDPDALFVGDMNAYAMEDPISAFESAGFVNTIATHVGADAYSYVFDGQSGYLDHALASPSLAGQVTGVTEWHTNADEPIALDYNTNFKSPGQVVSMYAPNAYRASDHDPVIVGLDLNDDPTVDAGGPYAVVEGGSVTVSATGSDPDDDSLTYAWDLDNNGSFETAGQSATFSAVGLEAPDTRTISVQVSDGSATGTDTATVNVIWGFSGFFSPVSNPPVFNPVNSGQAIAIRFSLDGDQGLAVLAAGSPTSAPASCLTGEPTGAAQPTSTTTGLAYVAATDTYIYPWKTAKSWTGCRLLTVSLADGTTHEALFRFTK
ncbi:MAG TPA: ExeM/NucH family extracellular endonuclease, partial [Nocardioidaceae bacterium]|nr:ExeM/NucH family extracellular endonuclease [Nocardioidaceae bacterium]